jgi:seryl-tRNA synthetase
MKPRLNANWDRGFVELASMRGKDARGFIIAIQFDKVNAFKCTHISIVVFLISW